MRLNEYMEACKNILEGQPVTVDGEPGKLGTILWDGEEAIVTFYTGWTEPDMPKTLGQRVAFEYIEFVNPPTLPVIKRNS